MSNEVKERILAECNTVEGMMLDVEMGLLYDYIWENTTEDGNTLEIGAYLGKVSYLFCAIKAEKYGMDKVSHFALDVFDKGVENNDYKYQWHTPDIYLKNLAKFSGKVTPIQGLSNRPDGWAKVLELNYDMVFIDGDHRYPQVFQDLLLADSVTDKIFGHDYGHKGVSKSVDLFCTKRGFKVNQWLTPYGLFNIEK